MRTDQRSQWKAGMAPYVERIWVQACIDAKKVREQKQRVIDAMLGRQQPEREEKA